MPHDKVGYEIKVGDRVLMTATVTAVHQGEDDCNCDVEIEGDGHSPFVTLNSKHLKIDWDNTPDITFKERAQVVINEAAEETWGEMKEDFEKLRLGSCDDLREYTPEQLQWFRNNVEVRR
jgi:hypothetical protein